MLLSGRILKMTLTNNENHPDQRGGAQIMSAITEQRRKLNGKSNAGF